MKQITLSLEALANLFVHELRENNWQQRRYTVGQGVPPHRSYNPGSSAFTIIGLTTITLPLERVSGEEYLDVEVAENQRRRLYSWQMKQLCATWGKERLICDRCRKGWWNAYLKEFKRGGKVYKHSGRCTLHAVIFGVVTKDGMMPVFSKAGDVLTNLEQARIAAGMARKSVVVKV